MDDKCLDFHSSQLCHNFHTGNSINFNIDRQKKRKQSMVFSHIIETVGIKVTLDFSQQKQSENNRMVLPVFLTS